MEQAKLKLNLNHREQSCSGETSSILELKQQKASDCCHLRHNRNCIVTNTCSVPAPGESSYRSFQYPIYINAFSPQEENVLVLRWQLFSGNKINVEWTFETYSTGSSQSWSVVGFMWNVPPKGINFPCWESSNWKIYLASLRCVCFE